MSETLQKRDDDSKPGKLTTAELIFDDPEASRNLVGFFNLAITVAKRNPELWKKINAHNTENHD